MVQRNIIQIIIIIIIDLKQIMKNKHIKYHQYKKIIRKLIILRNVIKHKILIHIIIINIHLIKLVEVEYNQQNQILEKIWN